MKVALMLSGQPRIAVKECFDSIQKHILDIYDTDVFCHLWWDEKISNNGFYVGLDNSKYYVDGDVPQMVKNLYSPKKIIIQPQIDVFSHTDLININRPSKESFLSQLYGLQQVSNLFDWYDYDLIIKWRYDLEVVNFLDLNEIDKTKFHTFCHILNDNGQVDPPYPDNFFDDTGYILPNDMKQYLQFIDNINKFKIYSGNCTPENILTKTLKLLELDYKLKRYHLSVFYGKIIR